MAVLYIYIYTIVSRLFIIIGYSFLYIIVFDYVDRMLNIILLIYKFCFAHNHGSDYSNSNNNNNRTFVKNYM